MKLILIMQNLLKDIQQWLQHHAPKIANLSLNSSVTETALNQLEQKIRKSLTQHFKDLYLWHNGMNEDENLGSLFYGMEFLSLERIENYREERSDLFDEIFVLGYADPQINKINAHHPDWIIFAHDGGRTGLYLDLAPTESGKIGQIIFVDHEYSVAILVADSMFALVQQFSEDLQQGLYHLNEDALEDDNEFLETDVSIDLVNWHNSTRWQKADLANKFF